MALSVHHSWIIQLAGDLAYPRLAELTSISDRSKNSRIEATLSSSLKSDFCLFFYPNKMAALTSVGYKIHEFGSSVFPRSEKYLFHSPELNNDYLRTLFTGLDFIVFKICHIYLEGQKSSYDVDDETFSKRFRRLQQVIQVPNWDVYFTNFKSIRSTRNGFAHSFIDAEQLQFEGIELRYCFGDTFNGPSYNDAAAYGKNIFMDKMKELYDPLDKAFISRQIEQIDSVKFFAACDDLIDR